MRPVSGASLAIPALIVAILVVGAGADRVRGGRIVVTAEQVRPTVEDHWVAAYGTYICDEFSENLGDRRARRSGRPARRTA